ncbi:ethanolaminephosphotransferase 1-like isoform X2 [Hemicordylus capensis]|uniref:ethanolaminephosphotransferase 1-like isoform X2 n=1 Tax=Hemicordylus capensis TaxID=884348 RepID=UPI0023032D86|nr:ethanolaminephosphotransferase 1-like isoform X2 [Hemicordylus capensis]
MDTAPAMWQSQYVTAIQLAGFRQYKYIAVDTNPLSVYVMQPLWERIVKILPLWIAPNLLTITGFVIILIHYFVLSFYDWDYTAADSIDGKHARRTRSNTPLGELFDHGLDSWASSVITLSVFSILSRDNGKVGTSVSTMYLCLCVILLNFMLSHWEKYNTGILFLPWSYDISQVVIVGLYLVTAAFGVEVWHTPFIFGYYLTDTLIMLIIVCCIFLSLPQMLYNIHIAYRKQALLKDSLYEGLLPLFSPMLLFALLTIWVALSPCQILVKQTRLFLWMTGVLFSNVMCRMIICQMTNTRSEVLHWLLVPLAVMVCTATAGFQGRLEEPILAAFAVLATAAHVHYGICVGKQLSQHFNIYIFSLKKRIQE